MYYARGNVQLLKETMTIAQTKYDEENADNYIIRCKNAIVIWYQPRTLITCVRFCEDKNGNEYHLYNCCHCFLAPGDRVKVFYTTNAAKGWIMARLGKPNYLNKYGSQVYNIQNCCDDDDDNDTCCGETIDTCCTTEAATQHQDKETVIIEEWSERIEGTEEEVREYEENEGRGSPFYYNKEGSEN